MSDEEELSPWQQGAKKMWEKRKRTPISDAAKEKMKKTKAKQKGTDAVFARVGRLEAIIRGFGFSEEEIRMM